MPSSASAKMTVATMRVRLCGHPADVDGETSVACCCVTCVTTSFAERCSADCVGVFAFTETLSAYPFIRHDRPGERHDMAAWFDAARKGDVAELRRHLDKGQDVNAKGGKGRTALLMAAEAGKTDAVRLLLERGADANVHAKGVGRPLTVAIEGDHWETAAALLDGGANPNHGGVAIYVIGDK